MKRIITVHDCNIFLVFLCFLQIEFFTGPRNPKLPFLIFITFFKELNKSIITGQKMDAVMENDDHYKTL